MSEQTPRDRAAAILAEHQHLRVRVDSSTQCRCGHHVSPEQFAQHQADMLAAAGLLTDPEQRECTCSPPPHTEGPEVDCDVHGLPSVAYQHGVREGEQSMQARYRWAEQQAMKLEDTLDELIARVEQDCNVDAREGTLPEDPDWAERITNLALYADQCREVFDRPAVAPHLGTATGEARS